jgi:hypothetical protein
MRQALATPVLTHDANVWVIEKDTLRTFRYQPGSSPEVTGPPNLSCESDILEVRIFFMHVALNPGII